VRTTTKARTEELKAHAKKSTEELKTKAVNTKNEMRYKALLEYQQVKRDAQGVLHPSVYKYTLGYPDELDRRRREARAPEDAPGAAVPFMMTKKMKVELMELGYDEKTISKLVPVIAHEILQKQIQPEDFFQKLEADKVAEEHASGSLENKAIEQGEGISTREGDQTDGREYQSSQVMIPNEVNKGAEGTADTPDTGVNIPFMITRVMKEELKQLGYTGQMIKSLTPVAAHEITQLKISAQEYQSQTNEGSLEAAEEKEVAEETPVSAIQIIDAKDKPADNQ